MKKTYAAPEAEILAFAAQDALSASDITGYGGVNWNDETGWNAN